MHKFGDVVLAEVQFTDTFETKIRPAVVLFEGYDNIVVMGVTSNLQMSGVPLLKTEGAVQDSVIKVNYIFTISSKMIKKKLFKLTQEKKDALMQELLKRIQ